MQDKWDVPKQRRGLAHGAGGIWKRGHVKIACVREGTDVCESLVYPANSKLSRASGSLQYHSAQWRAALDPDGPGSKSSGVASGHVVIFLSLSSSPAVTLLTCCDTGAPRNNAAPGQDPQDLAPISSMRCRT